MAAVRASLDERDLLLERNKEGFRAIESNIPSGNAPVARAIYRGHGARMTGAQGTARVPGACTSLLEALVGCGFRIGDPTLFMASRLFGRHELYLPSGPILY